MKHGLVVVAAAACTATASAQPAPPAPDPADVIARALAARQLPVLALPQRSVTQICHCAIEIGPPPARTRELALAAFRARNGADWRTNDPSFVPSIGPLRSVTAPAGGNVQAPVVKLTDDGALTLAVELFVANYELFGLTAADLAQVRTIVGAHRDDATAIARIIELSAGVSHASPGAAPVLARTWNARIVFGHDGKISSIGVAADDLLPPFHACAKPRLAATDAKVTKLVIGHHLSYADIAGSPRDAGEVVAGDITSITLIVFRAWKPDRTTATLRLAYEVLVHRGILPWAFIVDADTGELIELDQRFST